MQLKVVYKPKESSLDVDADYAQRVFYVDRQEDTYATFFDMVYKEVIGDDKLEKERQNFRLRAFNV